MSNSNNSQEQLSALEEETSRFDEIHSEDNSDPLSSSEYHDLQKDNNSYSTIRTAGHVNDGDDSLHQDATQVVHEMHLALLYLLSNPEEFQRAAATLAQWNADYNDNESLYTEAESVVQPPVVLDQQQSGGSNTTTPLPYAVFCDDAEVVLPQAHTASQLFGLELTTGMELEAAAGVPALSQLFLRWLALMPGGDHLNLIDPPGLTVMKICGGRYRVTACHSVVWTWMNEFAHFSDTKGEGATDSSAFALDHLAVGDLVSLTIVDVFETDSNGKLLSYCPTFDNRAVRKTDRTVHAIRKNTTKLKSALARVRESALAKTVVRNAGTLAQSVRQTVDDAVNNYNQKQLLQAKDPRHPAVPRTNSTVAAQSVAATSTYNGDDDMERHEI